MEELPFIFMQTSYIYQVCWANQHPTAMHNIQDLVNQGFVDNQNLSVSHAAVSKRRESLPDTLKLYFDQLEYFVALHEVFMGMRRFTQACQLIGVIKPLAFGSEKIIYQTRFKAFESI